MEECNGTHFMQVSNAADGAGLLILPVIILGTLGKIMLLCFIIVLNIFAIFSPQIYCGYFSDFLEVLSVWTCELSM
jgi:hypothetical protein